MTQTIYSYQQLQYKSIARLKQIYNDIICTVEVLDKRCKDAWINAIAEYQASRVQTVVNTTLDEQPTAEAIAPQLITAAINFDHHEVYVGKKLIAYMVYDNDEFVMQPWLVMVNGKDIFRAATSAKCLRYIHSRLSPARCHSYIKQMYQQGKLPLQE